MRWSEKRAEAQSGGDDANPPFEPSRAGGGSNGLPRGGAGDSPTASSPSQDASNSSGGGGGGGGDGGRGGRPQAVGPGLAFEFAGGRYAVASELGRGAHCAVWKCTRRSAGGEPAALALKVHLSPDSVSLTRESDALRALNAGLGAGLFPELLGSLRVLERPCIAIPIYGPDLYVLQKQRERRPFPPAFTWNVASHLLSALAALEAAGLVHTDIKPQNVVIRRLTPAEEPGGRPFALDHQTQLCLVDLGSALT